MKRTILSLLAAVSLAIPAYAAGYSDGNPTLQTSQSSMMTPEMLLTMARIGGFSLSPNGKQVVYSVSLPSIQDNKAKTQLFLVNSDGSGRKALTDGTRTAVSPRWIEGGKRIAYLTVIEGEMQLVSILPDGTDQRQVTRIPGGITGYLYSQDGKQLVYTADIKLPNEAKDRNPDLDKISGRVITDLMYKHWDEWVETAPHTFVASLSQQPITQGKDLLEGELFEAPMKPHSDESDIAITPDGKGIAYASRKKTGLEYSISTNSDIYYYDLTSGTTTNLTEGMMGYDTHPSFSPDGKYMTWCSMERDGYESDLIRLFLLDRTTGEKTYLTEGFEYNVGQPTWSQDGKSIYFIACVEAESHLYELTLKNKKIRRITQGQMDYVGFDLQGTTLVAARQSMLAPTDLYRIDLKKGTATAITKENESTLAQLGDIRCEKRWMNTTNGEKMLVWVLYPANFDASKKYPSILYCQGGPQSTISQFWSYRWNPRIMAENGYIVILPNRHGVPGFGKAWNEQISGDYGGQNMRDYLTAADEMKKEPYIDPNGMGCVGASYGGFSVYWLAGHHEKRFNCFIAHAGIFNLEAQYLETEEKWFANWDMGGAPWEKSNATAQRTFATSPHLFVDKWDTPILIIHGERDYRILASQGMMAFDAARMHGVPTEMLLYPDENHWVLQPQNAVLWQRTFFRWLDRWLKK
ncbi:S9 family peptidase [Porphyromonas endodontalis]|jgi:prolyl oligopeptidase family protein|uniref:S9 family peptidase n=1 Tax=Porphyromonas endodontalis TaxID=28124 RepID=UPI0028EF50E3|nr:S9 family peptidase [Porphyromonas endodontalis]